MAQALLRMLHMVPTWVLVGDRSRARLFLLARRDGGLRELRSFSRPDSRVKRSELVTGGRGRLRESTSEHRSAVEQPTDPKDHEADLFAQSLVAMLEGARK